MKNSPFQNFARTSLKLTVSRFVIFIRAYGTRWRSVEAASLSQPQHFSQVRPVCEAKGQLLNRPVNLKTITKSLVF
jgi:hypothetical protein